MSVFLDTVYPLVLAASLALAIFGVVTLFVQRAHGLLRLASMGFMIVVAVQALAVVYALVTTKAAVFMALAYLVAALAMLPLLGISRLGSPDAAAQDSERPVLSPRQAAKVDGAAAVLVAVASGVVSWRFYEIFLAAA